MPRGYGRQPGSHKKHWQSSSEVTGAALENSKIFARYTVQNVPVLHHVSQPIHQKYREENGVILTSVKAEETSHW